jgi:hypothetical protein
MTKPLQISDKELAKRLDELEKKYDAQFKIVFDAIREVYPVRDHLSCTMFM